MQGSAADILKKATMSALENLRKKSPGKKTDLILTIHDELLFECDENLAKNGWQRDEESNGGRREALQFESAFICRLENR